MKTVTALVSTLVLVLGCGLVLAGGPILTAPAYAAGLHPAPEATKKKTTKAKPKPTPTPTPSTATPAPTPTRSAVDIEGDRWVQLAVIAGGGLLAAVGVFFGIGALLRRKPRRPR